MKRTLLLRMTLLAAVAFGCGLLVARMKRDRVDASYVTDFSAFMSVPPERIAWREVAPLPLGPGEARAVATGPDGRIVVAIDDRIVFLGGVQSADIRVGEPVLCLAVAPQGLIIAGLNHSVAIYDARGIRTGSVTNLGTKPQVSSVTVYDGAVFIADAGQRCVWKAGFDGAILGQYPGPTPSGFIIPSGYFDVAAGADGVWVVNPGGHELTLLDTNLTELTKWRHDGLELEGFAGCCNPSHIAVLPTGGVVTSEKGIPRIKVYGRDGAFLEVVAPPSAFPNSDGPYEVAVDSQSRLLVLDPRRHAVRVFEHGQQGDVDNGR